MIRQQSLKVFITAWYTQEGKKYAINRFKDVFRNYIRLMFLRHGHNLQIYTLVKCKHVFGCSHSLLARTCSPFLWGHWHSRLLCSLCCLCLPEPEARTGWEVKALPGKDTNEVKVKRREQKFFQNPFRDTPHKSECWTFMVYFSQLL